MRLHRFVTALLVGLLAIAGGQLPAHAAGTASISGTVSSDAGGPLAGVDVVVRDEWSWEVAATATTGSVGAWTVTGLEAGDYWVEFDPQVGHVGENWNDKRGWDYDVITLTDGQARTGVNAGLAPAASITGTVTGPGGGPAADVDVTAYSYDAADDWWNAVASAMTDVDGTYELEVAAGSYRVCFDDYAAGLVDECWDDAADVQSATSVAAPRSGVDAQLAPGAHLSGTVTGADGQPLADADVDVYTQVDYDGDLYWESVAWGWTDVDGTYDVGGLRAGDYRVCFVDGNGDHVSECWQDAATVEEAQTISLASAATRGAVDAQLALGGRIAGQVTGPGGVPLLDIDVDVYAEVTEDGSIYWDQVAWSYTAADGTYEVEGLLADTYRVCFTDYYAGHVAECWNDQVSVQTADPVAVAAGATVGDVDASLVRGSKISGTVSSAPGVTYTEVYVDVYAPDGGDWDYVGGDWISGSSGTYEVDGLRAGSYRVCFWGERTGGSYDEECWNDQASIETADAVAVATSTTVGGIDAVLGNLSQTGYTNTSAPLVTGTAQVGQVLTASPGTWAPGGASYAYQWFSGATLVSTAGSTYVPTTADVGRSIQVRVVATGPSGTGAALSAPTAPVLAAPTVTNPNPAPLPVALANVTKPRIKGKPKVGKTLKVTSGQWTLDGVKTSYAWFANGKKIKKATATKLRLTRKQRGKKITVKVTAKASGQKVTVTTKATKKVR